MVSSSGWAVQKLGLLDFQPLYVVQIVVDDTRSHSCGNVSAVKTLCSIYYCTILGRTGVPVAIDIPSRQLHYALSWPVIVAREKSRFFEIMDGLHVGRLRTDSTLARLACEPCTVTPCLSFLFILGTVSSSGLN